MEDAAFMLLLVWLGVALGFFLGWLARGEPSDDWKHTHLSGVISLFQAGERAFETGKTLADNPFLMGYDYTPEARAWAFGYQWKEARHEVD